MSRRTLLWNSKQQPSFETFAQKVHRERRVRDALVREGVGAEDTSISCQVGLLLSPIVRKYKIHAKTV